ncbi:class C beta-lactamase [Pseudomonas purpurea]|uniref:class C beta-lactamase n=1 Tax=Pseudomonas purpurea TaxID=3136737 RepID=UPI00326461AE
MHENNRVTRATLSACALLLVAANCVAADQAEDRLKHIVDAAIQPLMQEQDIPGMAVAITLDGKPHYFNYGVASKLSGQAVTDDTLFEIGSVSKTFTTTLAAYAQATGKLSLSEQASHYLPALRGSAFDHVSVLNLGTYTAGGLPLQFPSKADDPHHMIGYFKQWKPTYAAGTHRLYSNPSLGLFGYLAAQSLGKPFDDLMENMLFPKLGLTHSYLKVPRDQMSLYAQGYTKDNTPVRVDPGALDSEAYGVKSSAADLVRYIEANIKPTTLDEPLQRAIALTHTGYYTTGGMTQGLGWEFYPYPVALDRLLAGNASHMALEPQKVTWLTPPQPQPENVLFNKTGSTGGFGAYLAFVPTRNMGIVLLANKNYPIPARIKVAHDILSALDARNGTGQQE